MTTIRRCLVPRCVVRGEHLPNPGEAHDADTCRGCLPRLAEVGNLCAWDMQRLQSDVATAPALIRHLREMAEPHAGAKPPGDGRAKGDAAYRSILSGAVNTADEVHAMLASWVLLVLEEHPHGAQMVGPDVRGAWLTRYGATAGVRDPEATARLVQWLLPHLPWCAGRDWAGEMRREVGDTVRTALARWPMEETRTRRIADTPCPACDRVSLTYTPPSWERAPFLVACSHPECGRQFTEDEWEWFLTMSGVNGKRAG